jgi:photosystem II stability/assembly factor-like uncharacterized protein
VRLLIHSGSLALALAWGLAPAHATAAVPAGAGTWQRIGPSGGQVWALAVDPLQPATLYAGSPGGGLFKSVNHGLTWSHIDQGLGNAAIYALAVDPRVPGTVYAASPPGVWKSLDGGASWSASSQGLGNVGVDTLAIAPSAASIVYASRANEVWKSTDGGASWAAAAPVASTSCVITALAVDPVSPAIVYAGSYCGLFKTTDGGAFWSAADNGLGNSLVTAVAIDPVLPRRVYAGQAFDSQHPHRPTLFVSIDRGRSWHASTQGLGNPWVLSLTVAPASHLTVFAGTLDGNVWKSTDGAASWTAAGNGLSGQPVGLLAADPANPDRLYAAGGSSMDEALPGVWKTGNGGGTWRLFNAGIDASVMTALAADPTGSGLLYAAMPGAGVLKLQAGAWQPANAGLRGVNVSTLVIDPQNPATLYSVTEAGFWKTTDGAGHWSDPSPGTAVAAPPLLIDPQSPATLYGLGRGGIQTSDDGGVNWRLLPVSTSGGSAALAASAPQNLYWTQFLAIDPIHPFSYVRHSADGGLTEAPPGQPFTSPLGELAVDPQSALTVYMKIYTKAGGGLIKSTDGAQTWTVLPVSCQTLLLTPDPPATLYVATTDATVMASRDGGASWTAVGGALPPGTDVVTMAFDPGSATLYLGTNGSGIYQLVPAGP